jgi:selenocysteine-specific elongation factor
MSAAGPLTLGTAGHIDHGKTSLIRALTGVDTDRLAAERQRGISIELGYARLQLPSGRQLSVIDVPGHERYVRTMVAGATGIDLFLMAIAADDGVMPQTREHAAILRALDVTRGVVAVTKAELTDPGDAVAQAAELLPGIEAVPVSSPTGAGLDALRAALQRAADAAISRAQDDGPARLHIDRVFSVRGAGTVVTGTLWSGAIGQGDMVELAPAGRRARVRAVQVHDEAVTSARAGQRVAVNLAGVTRSEVSRGDVLGTGLAETYRVDAALELSEEAEAEATRVQVHHGTRETPARLTWLGGRFWQVRLEQPLIAVAGDRVIVRRIAPPDTLGGGVILDAHPRRHGPSRQATERLSRLARGEPVEDDEPAAATETAGPEAPHPAEAPPLSPAALATEQHLRDAWLAPPLDAELDADDLAVLRVAGRAIRVSPTLHFHPDALAEAQRQIVELAGGPGGSVTLAQVRDALGSSRKFATALLAQLDSTRVTVRRGDEHVVRRAR